MKNLALVKTTDPTCRHCYISFFNCNLERKETVITDASNQDHIFISLNGIEFCSANN